jgi:hypothetical protein
VPEPVKAALGATARGVMAAGALALKVWPLALVIAAIAAGSHGNSGADAT